MRDKPQQERLSYRAVGFRRDPQVITGRIKIAAFSCLLIFGSIILTGYASRAQMTNSSALHFPGQ